MYKKLILVSIVVVVLAGLLGACAAKTDPLMGKWVDQVGDTWEFKADGKLSAVASGKAYDTTWTRVDDKTIKIDFGPILSMVGDPKAVLTIPYKISGDSLTLTVGGNDVPLTKSK